MGATYCEKQHNEGECILIKNFHQTILQICRQTVSNPMGGLSLSKDVLILL